MPWFLTPHGPHFVVEPGTIDEYERRDYTVMTPQEAADYFAGFGFTEPAPSFATEAQVPGIVTAAVQAGAGPLFAALRAAFGALDGSNEFQTEGAAGAVAIEANGDNGISSFMPMGWTPEPVMRLRVSHPAPDAGGYGAQHFQILPYEFGMGIEYPGVVECWVKEWSIHNNNDGSPDPGGAILWVGNDNDTGGLRMTAYNDGVGGKYAEITSELFDHTSGGDLRLQVRNTANSLRFRVGAVGSEVDAWSVDGQGNATSTGSVMANSGDPAGLQLVNDILGAIGTSPNQHINLVTKGTGAVSINGAAGNGTGALSVYSGGATPALVHQLDNGGVAQHYGRFDQPVLFLNAVASQSQPMAQFKRGATVKSQISAQGAFVSDDTAQGVVLKDAQVTAHYWRVTVSNTGVLTTTDLGTTRPA